MSNILNKNIIILLSGLYFSVYFIVFQPFGIAEIEFPAKITVISGYGLICIAVMFVNYYIFHFCNKFFKDEKLNLLKYSIYFLCNILIIAILSWMYTNYYGSEKTLTVGFFSVLFEVVIIAIFPIILFSLYFERMLYKNNLKTAQLVSQYLNNIKESQQESLITLKSENDKTRIQLLQSQLICIQANDNYSAVYYMEKNRKNLPGCKKKLLRISLKNIEQQLQDYEKTIVRCHKSYIVNLHNIEKVSGNAQGHKLHLNSLDFTIPVSRSFPKSILDKIKGINI